MRTVVYQGYKMQDDVIVIDPKRADFVKTVFSLRISGMSSNKIAKWANESGYRTHKDNLFDKGAINVMLKNSAYIGYDPDYPALLDSETFYLAQQVTRTISKSRTQKNSTLCWTCANAYGGCSWSQPYPKGKPVKGWVAVRNDIKCSSFNLSERKKKYLEESYIVKECPLYAKETKGE